MDFWDKLTEKFPQLEGFAFSNLMDRLEQLQPRDQKIVLIFLTSIVALTLFWVISGGQDKIQKKQKRDDVNQKTLVQVHNCVQNARSGGDICGQMKRRIRPASNFYLASFIEDQGRMSNVTISQIGSEKSKTLGDDIQEISTTVKVSPINFKKSIDLLTRLETNSSALIRLQKIRIKSIPNDKENVELDFKIAAYVQK
jgi:hypothetical protein